MKSITAYKCDQCDYLSSNPEDVERHEAKHYGLSLEEYKQWQELYDEAKKAAYTRNYTNTPETRKQFDAVIKKLAAFEKRMSLQPYNRPSHFM